MFDHFDRFASYLERHYKLKVDDIEPTSTPGYWRMKQPCGGRDVCPHPMHNFLFCEGPVRHTVYYRDLICRDKRGRFMPHYRTWKAARDRENEP